MTIYQAGAPQEGWNDLPAIPLKGGGGRKKRIRVDALTPSASPCPSSQPLPLLPTFPREQSLTLLTGAPPPSRTPSGCLIPPPSRTPSGCLIPPPSRTPSGSLGLSPSRTPSGLSLLELGPVVAERSILPVLERLLALPSSLPPKEFEFYQLRLINVTTLGLINTCGDAFELVCDLVDGVLTGKVTGEAAARRWVGFMAGNVERCGGWGAAFKKVVAAALIQ